MTTPESVGAALASLKAATGWSWAQLADAVGASSGDYVRKVASGAKPGLNLAGNVAELGARGYVTAPVPRRTTASGEIARVRAAGAARSVRPAPAPSVPSTTARELFRSSAGRLGWSRTFGTPHGAGRQAAGDEIVRELRSAGRGQGAAGPRGVSISVRVRFGDGTELEAGSLGQPVPLRIADVLAGIRDEGDVFDWIADQWEGRYGVTAGNVISVTVNVIPG